MEACGIIFFYLRAVFPLTLMLATASAQVCVPLGHSSLYLQIAIRRQLTLVQLALDTPCISHAH